MYAAQQVHTAGRSGKWVALTSAPPLMRKIVGRD